MLLISNAVYIDLGRKMLVGEFFSRRDELYRGNIEGDYSGFVSMMKSAAKMLAVFFKRYSISEQIEYLSCIFNQSKLQPCRVRIIRSNHY